MVMPERWSVTDLGAGSYQFRWFKGYFSIFVAGKDGVLAIDPVSPEAAPDYLAAVQSVTDAPITTVLYSHEHMDHIGGAADLAPGAEIIAHPEVARRIGQWPKEGLVAPTRLTEGDERLLFGEGGVDVHYFGVNHGRGNLALTVPTGEGRLLVYVDVAEPVFVPFRNLPDTDIDGLMASLKAADQLDVTRTCGGHTLPRGREWIAFNHDYVADMLQIMREEYPPKLKPEPGEDPVAYDERRRRVACQATVERLRPKYGHVRAYDAYAPYTADRLITYMVIGV